MLDVYTTPLLTARDAARHLVMPESTLDAWLAVKDEEPLVHSVEPDRRGWPRIPFIGVVEAHTLRALRTRLGMSMADLRSGARLLREELDDRYALASERLASDGAALFVKLDDQQIIHVRDRQLGTREVFNHFEKDIGRDEDGRLEFLRLGQYPNEAQVIIDPRFGWGSPVLADRKVPVEAMVSLWDAGETMDVVAEEFELSRDVVENVIRAAKRAA